MKKINTRKLAAAGLCSALICVFSVIAVPIGAVPISLSLFAVFVSGALLTPVYAFASALCYIALGAAGLPVFASFSSGVGVLAGPTGGYIAAYPFAALAVSLLVNLMKNRSFAALCMAMAAGLLVCYVAGTLWFSLSTGTSFAASLAICVLPFIGADALKIFAAAFMASRISRTGVLRVFDKE